VSLLDLVMVGMILRLGHFSAVSCMFNLKTSCRVRGILGKRVRAICLYRSAVLPYVILEFQS
jgi:hypothetical protein